MKTFKRILAVALSAFLIVPTMLTGLSVSAADVGYERSWDVVTSGGTVSVDNGALVAENTGAYATTKFITKSASTMDGFKANVLTNSDTITFALTTARDNYDELSEFACASDKTQGMERFGIVRATNLAAGEHTFNVTLSEFLDLGWYTYPGTLGDGIYDQAVFSVVHNGEHWDSSNNEIISLGIKQGEAFDFEMINHYDEDEAANIFGYSLNGTPVWPRTSGFDNYNDLDYYFVVMAYSINASSGNADLTVNTVCGVPAAEFKPELPKVAVIGEAAYTSLAEAYEAAVAGDTITLIGDVALDSVLNVEKDLTLDLGNYTITAAGNALRVSGANVVINAVNGGITAGEGGSYYAVCAVADALVTINGGNYTVGADENGEGNNTIYAAASNGVAGHIVINGGTFSSAATYAGIYWVLNGQDRTGATITVNGGKFVNFEPGVTVVAPEGTEEIILNPKATVTEADGVYTVKVVVAKIGDVEYKSLAEAYEAAVAGDTITLVANEDLTDVLLIEKNLTLDLGNYTITAAGNALRVRGANVTINAVNGGVTGGEGGSYCAVRSEAGALVTINGGNYTVGADENGEGNNTIYAATYSEDPDKVPGHVVINDGTFSTAAAYAEKYWVLNCQDRTGATITVNGGKFVNFEPGVTVVAPEGTEEILLGTCAVVTAEENVYTVAIKHTNTGALAVVDHAIVSDVCSVCGTVIQEAPAYDKFIIDGNPGTTAAFDENGDVTLTGTITKFVSKNTYEMNGLTIKANSTAPNAAFTITTTPSSYDDWAEWSQLKIGAGYGYYGNLTGNWTAGEYSLNITLSDFLDLGWTVLGTKDDNLYNVGTATICSNGNFWGDKSKSDFAIPMGEDFTLTVHNYYNEDDAGWELSYDVNGVYHYPEGMANAFKDANYKDYTVIAGANFTTLSVKEVTGLVHECVGAENTAYNSEIVCTICGKVIGYTPSLAADEKLITVSTADEIKDIFFIEGTYADYAEIKAAHASDASLFYTRRVGGTDKIVDGTTVVNTTKYGTFTVLTRLADGRSFIDTVEMVAPAAAENTIVVEGANANVTNNYGANFVMVFEGHYDTYAEAKAAKTTAPYFKSYSATKVNADGSYDVVLPAYGTEYTVVVRTLTGEYVLSYVQTEAKPAVVFDGLTFTGLENVTTVRYAKGTYTNVSDMKTSTEYRGIASRLFVDNTFTLKTALKGEYTIVYQYANGTMDISTLTF